jgi:hypothetical protein
MANAAVKDRFLLLEPLQERRNTTEEHPERNAKREKLAEFIQLVLRNPMIEDGCFGRAGVGVRLPLP